MKILLENVGKQFNKEWIFRNFNDNFLPDDATAITGPNGSGKSTLLQLIAGSLRPTKGKISYFLNGHSVENDKIYTHISMAAPALSVPEDFTLSEFIDFHFKFKKLRDGFVKEDLPGVCMLEHAKNKFIKNFSTGMKQRIKLGVAFYSDVPILLLDEPATNLDKSGLDWYLEEIEKLIGTKIILICSNRKEEYSFCQKNINIMDFK